MVSSLLFEEMRLKYMEIYNTYASSVRRISQNINKNNSSNWRFKSRGRYKSPKILLRYGFCKWFFRHDGFSHGIL